MPATSSRPSAQDRWPRWRPTGRAGGSAGCRRQEAGGEEVLDLDPGLVGGAGVARPPRRGPSGTGQVASRASIIRWVRCVDVGLVPGLGGGIVEGAVQQEHVVLGELVALALPGAVGDR